MPYLHQIFRISDVSNRIIEELEKLLDKVIGLKNAANAPTTSPSAPRPKHVKIEEGLREEKVPLEKV